MTQIRRPTPEQNARYLASWDEYKVRDIMISNMIRGGGSLAETLLRDQYVLGTFLGECLSEIGMPDEGAEQLCFSFGSLCFGRTDLWPLFDRILAHGEEQMKLLSQRKEWSEVPVPQDVPEPTDLLTSWFDYARRSVVPEGVYPLPYVKRNPDGQIVFSALAVSSADAMTHVVEDLKKGVTPSEFVLGIDMSAVPGQGIEFDDFLAVVWYVDGKFFSGVVNYQREGTSPDPAFRPIDWNNNYWNHSLRDLLIPRMGQSLSR